LEALRKPSPPPIIALSVVPSLHFIYLPPGKLYRGKQTRPHVQPMMSMMMFLLLLLSRSFLIQRILLILIQITISILPIRPPPPFATPSFSRQSSSGRSTPPLSFSPLPIAPTQFTPYYCSRSSPLPQPGTAAYSRSSSPRDAPLMRFDI